MKNKIIIISALMIGIALCSLLYNPGYKQPLGWDRYFQKFNKPVSNNLLVKYIDRNHQDGKQLIALDLGAGNGGDTVFLLEKGHKVYAVDFQEESMKRIKENVDEKYQHNLTLINSSFEDLDWSTFPQFDLIIAFRSISFIQSKDFYTVWDHMYTGLKDDGIVIVKLFGKQNTAILNYTMTLFDKKEIDQLINKFDPLYVNEILREQKKIRHEFDLIIKKT